MLLYGSWLAFMRKLACSARLKKGTRYSITLVSCSHFPNLNMSSQGKRFCFTWNNFDNGTKPLLEKFYEDHCQYLVFGNEISESGTPHYQGFFTLKVKKRLAALKKILGSTPHFEVAKGTSIQASDYCKKDGDYVEFGTPPTPGKRTDLEAACDAIKDGASMHDVAESHPTVFVKFGRGLRDLRLILQKPYHHAGVRGLWIWGPPGTGKSHSARLISESYYLKAQNKWFDGYNGEDVIILDDLDTNILGHYLKIWADKYACTGETKGGTIHLQHKMFIITSNYAPDSLWKEDEQMCEAVKRRFTVVHKTEKNQLIDHLILN